MISTMILTFELSEMFLVELGWLLWNELFPCVALAGAAYAKFLSLDFILFVVPLVLLWTGTYCSEEYSQTDYSFIIIIVSVEVYFCNNTINSAFAWLLTTSEAFLVCYQISIIYAAHAIFVYGSSTQKLCWFVSIISWKFFLMGVCIVLMEYSWIEILIQIF
jgi:hypothetical protein